MPSQQILFFRPLLAGNMNWAVPGPPTPLEARLPISEYPYCQLSGAVVRHLHA